MSRFLVLLRMNIRLLRRNKAFLFFLALAPIVAVVVLSLKVDSSLMVEKEERANIIELTACSDRAVNVADTSAFVLKVYDASQSELSEYVLTELAGSGMFSVCRCDASAMTEEEVLEQAKKDAFEDRAGALLYIKESFDKAICAGEYAQAMQLYDVSEDGRWDIFETELTELISVIQQLSSVVGMDSEMILEALTSVRAGMPKKTVVSFDGEEDITLTDEQSVYRSLIGYAYALVTLGFLFCGVCVAHTVIEEQDNKVYTRLMLSRLSQQEYLCSKLAMTVLIAIVQTMILGICMFIAKDMDFGINKLSFLILVFLLGLIFSTVSFVIGIFAGEVMSSNCAVFVIWNVSGMLAGVYFPLDDASPVLETISYLTPQRWFLKATEMLFVGDKSAFSMVICITVAYLVVIMSIGSIGLKVKRADA